jgi:hypothetical protein
VKDFNLSDWALGHRSLVWYFMIIFMVAGVFAYLNLGREEDPAFTIKTMLIQANWPGASVDETIMQVTDRIEKKLEELDSLDYTRSITTAWKVRRLRQPQTYDAGAAVEPTWVEVRNMINDIRINFPQGVLGPFFNDRFGDVYRQHLRLHVRRADSRASCATMSRSCAAAFSPFRTPARSTWSARRTRRSTSSSRPVRSPRSAQPAGGHPELAGAERHHAVGRRRSRR